MTPRDAVFPAGSRALYEANRYSPAVRSNGFLFVSGQVGSREDGSPEPELEAQVRRAFDNLNAVLSAAGCSFDDVVDVSVERARWLQRSREAPYVSRIRHPPRPEWDSKVAATCKKFAQKAPLQSSEQTTEWESEHSLWLTAHESP